MKIKVEYNQHIIYNMYIKGKKVFIDYDDIYDHELALNEQVLVTELLRYNISNLSELFSVLKQKNTVVLDIDTESSALVYNGSLTTPLLESPIWFDYYNNSHVLMSLIENDFFCAQHKPKTMTVAQMITNYGIIE